MPSRTVPMGAFAALLVGPACAFFQPAALGVPRPSLRASAERPAPSTKRRMPNAERRTGWGLGPMHSKLVEITDAYDIYPSLEAAKAAAEAESVNMVADKFTGVIDSERHHIPRVTTTTVDQLPALPTAPGNAYAAWILDKPVVESTREAPIAECPPPSVVNAASWSSNGRVQQVAADRRAADVSAKAAAKEHEAKRRAHGHVFVNDRDMCAAEMSVPSAQQAAAPADVMKVETMNEHKKIKMKEKKIKMKKIR